MKGHPTIVYLKICENIDYSLFALENISNMLNKEPNRLPIEIMVDNATGFKAKKDKETITAVLYHLRRIVRYKKKLNKEFEYSHSTAAAQKSINSLNKLLKEFKD